MYAYISLFKWVAGLKIHKNAIYFIGLKIYIEFLTLNTPNRMILPLLDPSTCYLIYLDLDVI